MSLDLIDDKSSLVQVISWTNVDPDLCRQMSSLGRNELMQYQVHYYAPVLKLRQICHARDRWKLTRSVNGCVYYAHHTHEIDEILPYSMDFKHPGEI